MGEAGLRGPLLPRRSRPRRRRRRCSRRRARARHPWMMTGGASGDQDLAQAAGSSTPGTRGGTAQARISAREAASRPGRRWPTWRRSAINVAWGGLPSRRGTASRFPAGAWRSAMMAGCRGRRGPFERGRRRGFSPSEAGGVFMPPPEESPRDAACRFATRRVARGRDLPRAVLEHWSRGGDGRSPRQLHAEERRDGAGSALALASGEVEAGCWKLSPACPSCCSFLPLAFTRTTRARRVGIHLPTQETCVVLQRNITSARTQQNGSN